MQKLFLRFYYFLDNLQSNLFHNRNVQNILTCKRFCSILCYPNFMWRHVPQFKKKISKLL